MSTPFTPHVHPFTIALQPAGSPPTGSQSGGHSPDARAERTEPRTNPQERPSPPVRVDDPDVVRHGSPAAHESSHRISHAESARHVPSADHRQAIDLVTRMLLVAREAKAALDNRLAEFDLNDIRYSVLSIVREAASEGCSQSMLAQKLRQSESSISTLVDRMRTSGLLYRLRSKTDRRKRYLTLTERGRQLLQGVDARYGECVDDILSGLGAEDRTIMGVLLKRLLVQLDGESATERQSNAA